MHKDLVESDSELAYFRSVVLIGKEDYDEIKSFLQKDPKITVCKTDGLSHQEKFIKEMCEYGGFKEDKIKELLKDEGDSSLSKKTNIISDW